MLIFKRTLPVLAAVTALAGCSMMPTYERPGAPVPAQWPNPIEQGKSFDSAVPVADLAWPDYFVDTSLRQVIDIALLNNRDLRVAVLNIEQARAQLGLRRADQLPTLNATTTGSRAPTSSGGISSSYAAGLTVTAYEIDFFGRVASLKEQALAQIAQGVDIIFQNADAAGLGVFQAAREKKILAFGTNADQNSVAPDVIIGSVVIDLPKAFLIIAREVQAGTFRGRVINFGVNDDVVRLVLNPAMRERVPAAALAASDSVGAQLKAGTFTALLDLQTGADSAKPLPPAK